MKKYIFLISLTSALIFPSLIYAAWWNPLDWFKGIELNNQQKELSTTTQKFNDESITASTTIPAMTEKIIYKPIEKEVVKDLTQEKINEYESIIQNLKDEIEKLIAENEKLTNENKELKNLLNVNININTSYKEVKDLEGDIIRIYPNSSSSLEDLVILSSDGTKPISGLVIKVIGYDRNDVKKSETYFTSDKNGLIEKINLSIKYDVLGNPIYYYKFYKVKYNNTEYKNVDEFLKIPLNLN